MNPEQFGQLAKELDANGGFTAHLPTGYRPTSGYVVSDVGHEESSPMGSTTGATLAGYASRQHLTSAAPGKMMGGWRNAKAPDNPTGDDRDYLDQSRHYSSLPAAKAAGYWNNQLALYDVGHDRVITNPAPQAQVPQRVPPMAHQRMIQRPVTVRRPR